MTSAIDARFVSGVLAPRVELGDATCSLLANYANAIAEWNQRINLTGARDPETIVREHLADALPLVPHLPRGPFRLLDVGSGAGFPGLVLAILRPDADCLLLEPNRKKHGFLRAMRRELPVPNVIAHCGRFDEFDASSFQVLVSRALWPPSEWIQRASQAAAPGSLILAQAGADPGAIPGSEAHPYELAGALRHVLVTHCEARSLG